MLTGPVVVLTVTLWSISEASKQFLGVKGVLFCENQAYKGAKIKLFDDDRGLDTDDLMAEGWSGDDGSFYISGSESEVFTIDPKVNIYHDCLDTMPCQRKFTIYIPKEYVTEEGEPIKFFDVGVLNLDGQFPEEGRDCLH